MKTEAGSLSASHPGETVVPGSGAGALLVLDEPLSFWGGYDAQAGAIVEPRHPQCGMSLRGRTMLMARAKGSSSSSSVLAEAIRNGTGPAAIVMRDRDLIVALGCIVASELYGVDVPIAVVDAATWKTLTMMPAGTVLRVDAAMDRCVIAPHIEGAAAPGITGTPSP
jgi:predicted aconitase with swiveling domain